MNQPQMIEKNKSMFMITTHSLFVGVCLICDYLQYITWHLPKHSNTMFESFTKSSKIHRSYSRSET